jgi:ABC-type lipoprotein release transport system permease subunit
VAGDNIGLTIGLASIMYHAIKAASTNPAEALRYKQPAEIT